MVRRFFSRFHLLSALLFAGDCVWNVVAAATPPSAAGSHSPADDSDNESTSSSW
ncbi:unnamed protein product, partial [Amoebophrya sp. A25]|eukprot:GSA25T00025385001.1